MTEEASTNQGKGRPTPSRKDAEAAARARTRRPRTRKEYAAAQRSNRTENAAKMREAMRTGDDRYLPARDKGPVKRYVRDWIDRRFTISEMILPILFIALASGLSRSTTVTTVSQLVMLLAVVVVALEMMTLRIFMRRDLRRQFPDESLRGITYYAVMRMMQFRWLRMPKPQLRIGQDLPERYR